MDLADKISGEDELAAQFRKDSVLKVTANSRVGNVITSGTAVSRTRISGFRNSWAFLAIIMALSLTAVVFGVHYFSAPDRLLSLQTVGARIIDWSPAKSAPDAALDPASTASHDPLQRAAEFEKRENYDQAIDAYEAYLGQNPKVKNAGDIGVRIAEIRKVKVLIDAGKIAADGNRLEDARQYYAEALHIKPDSQIARLALAEVERNANRRNINSR
jgi:tetratricopeptide (TPR) repeat protein